MKKTINLKDIIHEYENMTLENAITVIMDTPLSKLLNLTENDKDMFSASLNVTMPPPVTSSRSETS